MARISTHGALTPDATALLHYRPAQAEAGFNFSSVVYQNTTLPFRLVEAARHRTAQINGCQTCQTWRAGRDLAPVLLAKGGDPQTSFIGRGEPEPDDSFYAEIDTWRTSKMFSPRERLAIEYAERMGTDPRSFEGDDPFWEQMHVHFTDEEIVDLTLSVGSWIAMGRVLHVLEIDPQVCAVPALQV